MNPIAPLMFDVTIKATVQEIAHQVLAQNPKQISQANQTQPKITKLTTPQTQDRKAA